MANRLARLIEAWSSMEQARARGGERALEGFHYQFLVTLHVAVQRWLQLDAAARASHQILAELLSDIASTGSGDVVWVQQVKLRQRSQTVSDALQEFWAVREVAVRAVPEIVAQLRFRIISRQSELVDVRRTIERWIPEGPNVSDEVCREFHRSIDAITSPDPESETVALLVNHLRAERPIDLIREWLGKLMTAARSSDTLRAFAHGLWQDLYALEASAGQGDRGWAYVWTTRDRSPADVERGDFLTGQLPGPRDLRAGRFAPRDHIIGPLASRVTDWLSSHPAALDAQHRLPVFWIAGRSGCGKSVVLLHLLARLHEVGHAPIVWLGNNFQRLTDAVSWGARMRRPGETAIVAIDDPYAPAAQHDAASTWQNATAQLLSLRQEDDPSELPVVLTCGPTEQAERLEADFPDEVAVTIYPLPDEDPADIEELREWYRGRTGEEPPLAGDENILLVQLFFEWRVRATLPEFARRFRRRIEAEDATLVDWFAKVLALNRLYVGHFGGISTLSLDAQALVKRLRDEHHLVEDIDEARPGIWLAHPHLSDAIYASWYPQGKFVPHRRAHVQTGVRDALAHGDDPSKRAAPLWALIRSLPSSRSDTVIAQRLADVDVPEVLQELYEESMREHQDKLPVSLMPPWLTVSILVKNRRLLPDPVELALDALQPENIAEKGMRLTCHVLLSNLDRLPALEHRRRVVTSILTLLEAAFQWHEWPHIARHMANAAPNDRLWSVIADWASGHPANRLLPQLLRLGLQRAPNHERLREAAGQLLRTATDDVAWGDVAKVLSRSLHEGIPAAVRLWVERHQTSMGIRFLLARLVEIGDIRSVILAKQWTSLWYRERTANFVIEPLLEGNGTDPDVLDWSFEWLKLDYPNAGRVVKYLLIAAGDRPNVQATAQAWVRRHLDDDQSWSFGWEGIWNRHRGNPELVGLASYWLQNESPSHGSWAFVWEALWQAAPGDPDLATMARQWLTAVGPDHGSWPYVWNPLWEAARGDPDLATMARQWLTGIGSKHGSWKFVWEALWAAGPDDPDLATIAQQWLTGIDPNHGSWKGVWEALWAAAPGAPDLATIARQWLTAVDPNHGSWQYVWNPLWQAAPGDPELAATGVRWLGAADPQHGSWAFVWGALWQAAPGDPELATTGVRWLGAVDPQHGSWAFVWGALWKATPGNPDLATIARQWLTAVDPNHGSWQYIWNPLRQAAPGDPDLATIARQWLTAVDPKHGSWQFVWDILWAAAPGDTDLTAIARQWLTAVDPNHGSWQYVWNPLWQAARDDPDLANIARRWLATVQLTHKSWAFVWLALWSLSVADQNLLELAARFVDGTDSGQPRRGEVARVIGRERMDPLPEEFSDPLWAKGWISAFSQTKDTTSFGPIGLRWLSSSFDDRLWASVFLRLWDSGYEQSSLRKFGLTWLTRYPNGRRVTEVIAALEGFTS